MLNYHHVDKYDGLGWKEIEFCYSLRRACIALFGSLLSKFAQTQESLESTFDIVHKCD